MSPNDAMERINGLMPHAWMVRQFLKHSEDAEDDEDMLAVHRTIFDFIRAVEPSYQRKDAKEYLRRLRGKLPKLRKAAEYLSENYHEVSTHTNFEMAAASLSGCVREIERTLESVKMPMTNEQ